MTYFHRLASIGAIAVFSAGCGDSNNDDSDGTAGTGGMTATGGTGGGGTGGGGTGGSAGMSTGGMGGGGSNSPPTIDGVSWEAPPGCMNGSTGDFTIMVTASDPDGDTLTYSGSVSSCMGMIDAASSTVSCPNFSPYAGTVTVTDSNGASAMATFTINPCESGSI